MHSPFDDGDIQCDTAPWRGGMVLPSRKFTFILLFVPSSPPPSPGHSVNKQAFLPLGDLWIQCLLGNSPSSKLEGQPRKPALVSVCLCSQVLGLCGSCHFPFCFLRGSKENQCGLLVKNTGFCSQMSLNSNSGSVIFWLCYFE
jgi:hypothetical protein